ncbi:MAG: PD-(D/E)XK nuclease family protein, partial [Solirubrobacterales bacterium]
TQAVGLDADVVIVCGCVEGLLPHRPGLDPLLPAADRAMLREAGAEIRSPRESVPQQHRDFLAAAAAASDRMVLTMPRGDLRRTTSHIPSRWLLEIAAELVGKEKLQPREFEGLTDNPAIRHVQSFGSGLTALTNPATAQEFSIRSAALTDPLDSKDPVLARNAEMTTARRSHSFTRFDGNLAGAPVPDVSELVFSPTGLEAYVACPYAYFLSKLLRVEPLEPDDEQRMTSLDRGSLIHEVLERFIDDSLSIDSGHAWTTAELARLTALANEVCDRYESEGRTGHPLIWATDRSRLLRELTDFIAHEQARRRSLGLSPRLTELRFGYAGDPLEEFNIALPSGRSVKVRGSIDRVDVTQDGDLAIHDYKTGQQKYFKAISEDDPFAGNSKLQLPIYGFAARAAAEAGVIEGAAKDGSVTAGYWFFGVDSGKRTDVVLTESVEAQARELIESIVGLISRGVFPQRPPESYGRGSSNCDYCAPNGRGIAAVQENWSRIENDPLLEDYLRLAMLVEEDEDRS